MSKNVNAEEGYSGVLVLDDSSVWCHLKVERIVSWMVSRGTMGFNVVEEDFLIENASG